MALPDAFMTRNQSSSESRQILAGHDANELIFAVVGHVGSGTSDVARTLQNLLEDKRLPGGPYEVEVLKARSQIEEWAISIGDKPITTKNDDINTVSELQNRGDRMRQNDDSAVARALIKAIRATRAKRQGKPLDKDPVVPDGKRRAYILDSIRHPAEVNLLRHVYESAFTLVGVVCEQDKRRDRIVKKYRNAGNRDAEEFMRRDAKDSSLKHGQRVSDAFHLSDFFIDNSIDRLKETGIPNEDWNVADELNRLIKIITHEELVRPKIDETAMYEAYGAAMRSACLSRQVGAALVNNSGDIVAIGTNEVPKAGGGVYGEGFIEDPSEARCAYWSLPDKYCSNTREQNEIIQELINVMLDLRLCEAGAVEALKRRLQDSRIGSLLEFSRAVHAEWTR